MSQAAYFKGDNKQLVRMSYILEYDHAVFVLTIELMKIWYLAYFGTLFSNFGLFFALDFMINLQCGKPQHINVLHIIAFILLDFFNFDDAMVPCLLWKCSVQIWVILTPFFQGGKFKTWRYFILLPRSVLQHTMYSKSYHN